MSSVSLLSLTRKNSLKWTGVVAILTVLFCSSLIVFLFLKDSEREILVTGKTAIASFRTDILGGNIRSVELQLNSDLKKAEQDLFVFLDQDKRPWISNPNLTYSGSCSKPGIICRDLGSGRLIIDIPIYFDSDGHSLWGFLHLEKVPNIHWEIILTVSLTFLFGMLGLALLLHTRFMHSISIVSSTMLSWSEQLQKNPKDSQRFDSVPFEELAPIAYSLRGLNKEISNLEDSAQKRGSLNTLRSIGHDILNPVSRMKRIFGVLKTQSNTNDEPLINSLESNLKRLSGYAEQIKSLYKRESGELDQNPLTTDLSLEVKSLTNDLIDDSDAIQKNIKFELLLTEQCLVSAPSSILSRIAENIIVNSIHASPNNSTVRVTTARENGSVTLKVTDSGSGISESIRDKIFDANFTTKTNKGTGLGLFVVKQLCEEIGGTISCFSATGNGTTFEISFPQAGIQS